MSSKKYYNPLIHYKIACLSLHCVLYMHVCERLNIRFFLTISINFLKILVTTFSNFFFKQEFLRHLMKELINNFDYY